MPVLRHNPDASLGNSLGLSVGEFASRNEEASRGHRGKSGDDGAQLALTVALNARDSDKFASSDLEADCVKSLHAELIMDSNIIDQERAFANVPRSPVEGHGLLFDELDFAAD